jgi:hypothetical protein
MAEERSMTMIPSLEVAAIVGLCLLCAQTVRAEPMKCSGEQKTCLANCNKIPNRASVCATGCGARQSYCIRTGCWDNGVQRYCGLLRQ